MEVSIQWTNGPDLSVVKQVTKKQGRTIHFVRKLKFFDYPKECRRLVILNHVTALEAHDFRSGMWVSLTEAGVQASDIMENFNGGSPSAYALDLVVSIDEAIKLLKKAPRDKMVAEVRRKLKSVLK